MKKRTSNYKGVAMIWAVLVILIISLVSAGIILVCQIYYQREKNACNELQAQFYAESAVTIIENDILNTHGYTDEDGNELTNYSSSEYLSTTNSRDVYTLDFPDVSNWTVQVTVNHSCLDSSVEVPADDATDEKKKEYQMDQKNTGVLYLTGTVTRSDGEVLGEACLKMKFSETAGWQAIGWYKL